MKFLIAAFLAAWICFAPAFAQTNLKISGKITDADGKALDGATIYLKRAADSVLVKSALAEADGRFVLTGLKPGSYKLAIALMSYANYRNDTIKLNDQDLIMPEIRLKATGKALKEVVITSAKPFVEHQIDRTVVNVDALISNAGSSAMDVLEKSPGVIVDQNGSVSLNGKSVQIFIDDKPTYLSGTELENYLRSLSSSTLDQVELMPNPPAKYDAAGNGGVINIRTKRIKATGFNGSINLSYSQGKYGKTNNSFNFNYRQNELNVFGNLAYSTNNSGNDLDINREFLGTNGAITSIFMQKDFIKRYGKNYNAKIGLDYYATDKTTFGMVLTGVYNPAENPTQNTSTFFNPQNRLDSTIVANNQNKSTFKNSGVNFNYRHAYDKKGHELSADFDYLLYKSKNDQSYNNISTLPNGTITNNDLLTGYLPGTIHIYSAKADYSQPLVSGIKLSAGAKSSYTQTDNIANYYYTLNNTTLPDYGKTNHFLYRENINAAYINANKDFKRLSIQVGLRMENTISQGHQLGNLQKPDSLFKNNYTSLFPTLYLQYKLDSAGHQQLTFDYGRRISRPYYEDLNPFLSPLDKFTYYTGNPFLKPSYTQNFELGYTYKNITTTLGYSKVKDDVNETIEILNGIYYSRPGNLGTKEYTSLTVDAGFDLAKWLNLHFFGYVENIHTVSNFYTGPLNTQGTFCFLRPILQFKTGKDWSFQADGSYQSQVTNSQFISRSKYRTNLALAKKLSSATTVRLVMNDIFNTFVNAGDINDLANTLANYHNKGDSRTAVISLSYRFGKNISGQRKHEANGAESEQDRVKN